MADTSVQFTPEQWEQMKIVLMIIGAIPGYFLFRFVIFMILPKSVLRYLFLGKRTKPETHKDKWKERF